MPINSVSITDSINLFTDEPKYSCEVRFLVHCSWVQSVRIYIKLILLC